MSLDRFCGFAERFLTDEQGRPLVVYRFQGDPDTPGRKASWAAARVEKVAAKSMTPLLPQPGGFGSGARVGHADGHRVGTGHAPWAAMARDHLPGSRNLIRPQLREWRRVRTN